MHTLKMSDLFKMPFKKVAPKWGLVLMGGGSKGLAHIGVLNVLQKNGLIPDIIVGTSMGGLIGGLYAYGMSIAQIKEAANNLQKNKLISRLKSVLVAQKHERLFDYLILGNYKNELLDKFGFHREDCLEEYLKNLIGEVNIEDLPIKFACNALDLVSGKEIVFENGKLHKAVRATMSYPLLFEPAPIDNMLLIDGGAVNNAPVDIAKSLGADMIILVDIHSSMKKMAKAECKSIVHLAQRTIEAMSLKSIEEKMEIADLVIRVNFDFSMFDFSAPKNVIAEGEMAAEKELYKVKRLLESNKSCLRRVSLKSKGVRSERRIVRQNGIYTKSRRFWKDHYSFPLKMKH